MGCGFDWGSGFGFGLSFGYVFLVAFEEAFDRVRIREEFEVFRDGLFGGGGLTVLL